MQDFQDYDDGAGADGRGAPSDRGPVLPGGISVKTAATALFIVAVAATLWLALVPRGSEPTDLPTPTPRAGATTVSGLRGGTPVGLLTPGTTVAPVVGVSPSPGANETPAAAPVGAAALATSPSAPVAPGAGVAVGGFAKVTGTGPDGMRYRYGPGLNFVTIRIVNDGETLKVLGGPESGDGFAWWRLQDNLGNVGWGAEQFIAPIAAPAAWNPPVASPTFVAGQNTPAVPGTP